MKRLFPVIALSVLAGFFAGRITTPTETAHAQAAAAPQQQPPAGDAMPFGFNRPGRPVQAPDAPPETVYWNIDDIRKAHAALADRAAKAPTQTGLFSGGNTVRMSTRVFSMSMIYRSHRDAPVASLTKVNSVWDDAEQHAGVYDFYIITGGSGEMVVGGKIANRQNLADPSGLVPGEYRGQPIDGGKTYKVKEGDWLVIPPDVPHQAKPDAGGFSYMIMKINTGMYPWSLIR
jgi:mannose-6-phosphate isomerase-like protein (cupin superfamily)